MLVETAERLFAERGIESVSLRDVCAAAAQGNHSAAQYHFGDRAGLVAAVYEHRMRSVNDRRQAMLAAAGDHPPLGELVRAIVEPLVAVIAETEGWYGRFLARTQWDTFARELVLELPVVDSYRRACELVLAQHFAGVDRQLAVNRIDQMGSVLIGTIAGWEWRLHRREPRLAVEALQTDLVATITATLTAPIDLSVATARGGHR